MSGEAVYLDSSALVKLVVAEPETEALVAWLKPAMALTTCGLARTEVMRSVVPAGAAAATRARELLLRLDIVAIDDLVLDAAAFLEPSTLRALDAIHLAAAITLGDDLGAFVAYDRRLLAAARLVGLPAVAPGT